VIDPRRLTPAEIAEVAGQLRGETHGSLIDSTLLSSQATAAQIDALVDEALELGTNVCVNESRLNRAITRLRNQAGKSRRRLLAITVAGFPLGACTTETKIAATVQALRMGADEVDIVANVGLLKDGDSTGYSRDIDAVAAAVAEFNASSQRRRGLKVIIECCLLTDAEKERAAAAVAEIGLHREIPIFVKTSTGLAHPPDGRPAGATIEDVLLIRRVAGAFHPERNTVGVKAAGGIRDAVTALRFIIAAGAVDDNLRLIDQPACAARIGTSSAAVVVSGFGDLFVKT
jgi:deoxyribose-phosphate aldolase